MIIDEGNSIRIEGVVDIKMGCTCNICERCYSYPVSWVPEWHDICPECAKRLKRILYPEGVKDD